MVDREVKQAGRSRRKRARPVAPSETERKLYEDLFTADERAALAGAATTNDLEQELELLRVLIRRGVAEGLDLETLSRSIARLAQARRVQHVVRGQAARSLDAALARALDEIGDELGL